MRNLIFIAVLATSVSSLSFLEKAQGYLSGNASISASGSANTGGSGSNFLSGIQNSSFGQAVMGGINYYNQAKNNTGSSTSNWQTALANSSVGNFYQQGVNFFNGASNNGSGSFIDTAAIQQ
uniref:Curlin n=1 Tax=Caenorhabditis tropicalis TaxID=1561998 RepID=A0A1I7UFM4_9PELO